MTSPTLVRSRLPLPLVHRGKVREMYDAGDGRLLMVASDRVSAFDVVMAEPVPRKGEVLTLLTAWWLQAIRGADASAGSNEFAAEGLSGLRHHALTADPDEILAALPELAETREQWVRRSLLVRRTEPLPVECVVRGYLAGSAWAEYRTSGTLAGEPLPSDLRQSQELDEPIFSPATKATEGHDENIPFQGVVDRVGGEMARELKARSLALYGYGAGVARERGILLADTKFEFGVDPDGRLTLIDEVLTPDSSRYWPSEGHALDRSPPSLDKQPIRDHLDALPDWDRSPPPPPLSPEVVKAATHRYLEIFRRLAGVELDEFRPPGSLQLQPEGS